MDNAIRERFLMTELQQNYSWMQELLKQLLAWYAFFFTTNVVLLGYLANEDRQSGLGPLPYLMLFLAVCGVFLVVVARQYFVSADARTRLLVQNLNGLVEGKNELEMRSVFPCGAVSTGLLFLAFGLVALAVVWGVLAS